MVRGYVDWSRNKLLDMKFTTQGEIVNHPAGPGGGPLATLLARLHPDYIDIPHGYYAIKFIVASGGNPPHIIFEYYSRWVLSERWEAHLYLPSVKTLLFGLPGPIFFDDDHWILIYVVGPLTGYYQGSIAYGYCS